MRSREEEAKIKAAWDGIFARIDEAAARSPIHNPCYRCGRCRGGLFAQCKALANAGFRIVPTPSTTGGGDGRSPANQEQESKQ